ncbi:MAG: DUF3866 family protein [Pseudomonadota bacterium]
MIETIIAEVNDIISRDENVTLFRAVIEGVSYNCISYNELCGEISLLDTVVLNTTAISLGLGSGGYHLAIASLGRRKYSNIQNGHIMKLRYTPMQINVMAAEAQESKWHRVFDKFESLEGMPVVVGTLHSMVAPAALSLKYIAGKNRLAYIMTDGGALPIYISETVKLLKEMNVLTKTITYGNAFGGDIECINIYTALIAAKEILKSEAAVVCMGPGIAGTGTKYGFSGIEQGQILDAVNNLGGKAIAIPRVSFKETRERHFGLSHHSRTILGNICLTRASIAMPVLDQEKNELLYRQLEENSISSKHDIYFFKTDAVEKLLDNDLFPYDKMGTGYSEDREYFNTCGLSALLAIN